MENKLLFRFDIYLMLTSVTFLKWAQQYTHQRIVSLYFGLKMLSKTDQLFIYLYQIEKRIEIIPNISNRIKGGVNAPNRRLLGFYKGYEF